MFIKSQSMNQCAFYKIIKKLVENSLQYTLLYKTWGDSNQSAVELGCQPNPSISITAQVTTGLVNDAPFGITKGKEYL